MLDEGPTVIDFECTQLRRRSALRRRRKRIKTLAAALLVGVGAACIFFTGWAVARAG